MQLSCETKGNGGKLKAAISAINHNQIQPKGHNLILIQGHQCCSSVSLTAKQHTVIQAEKTPSALENYILLNSELCKNQISRITNGRSPQFHWGHHPTLLLCVTNWEHCTRRHCTIQLVYMHYNPVIIRVKQLSCRHHRQITLTTLRPS